MFEVSTPKMRYYIFVFILWILVSEGFYSKLKVTAQTTFITTQWRLNICFSLSALQEACSDDPFPIFNICYCFFNYFFFKYSSERIQFSLFLVVLIQFIAIIFLSALGLQSNNVLLHLPSSILSMCLAHFQFWLAIYC